jgi:hypothetical protein
MRWLERDGDLESSLAPTCRPWKLCLGSLQDRNDCGVSNRCRGDCAHGHAHGHAQKHARTHSHAHAHTHTHTHSHVRAYTHTATRSSTHRASRGHSGSTAACPSRGSASCCCGCRRVLKRVDACKRILVGKHQAKSFILAKLRPVETHCRHTSVARQLHFYRRAVCVFFVGGVVAAGAPRAR